MICCLLTTTDVLALKVKDRLRLIDCESKDIIAASVVELMDKKRFAEAELQLDKLLHWPYRQESVPFLFIRAELYHLQNDFVGEAKTYDDILQLSPNDKKANRSRVNALLRMGAPLLAWQYAQQQKEIFSRNELLEIQRAAINKKIAWGRLEERQGRGQQRFATTDKALQENNRTRIAFGLMETETDTVSRTMKQQQDFNQILALRNRSRMQEVIDFYQQLLKENAVFPAPVLAATADAYVHLHQPKLAIDLFLKALNKGDKPDQESRWQWQLNLVNAYIDDNEFDAAQHLIDRLVTEIPPVLNRGMRGVEIDNEYFEAANITQAQQRIYSDQYDEGQTLLEQLLASAPANTAARLAYADLLQYREQPRAAQWQYASALVDDPASNTAAAGIAETAIYLQDYQTAQRQLQTLFQHYPENLEVQRIQKLFDAYRSPLLTVTSGWGSSPTGGGRRGSEDWQVDAIQYSPVINHHWRVFAHSYNAEATFSETKGRRQRAGIGADYRFPLWRLSGEINQDQGRFDNYGTNIQATWLPDDHWLVELAYDNNSNDIPLQASAAAISMDTAKLKLNYVWNESRSITSNLNYGWFTDKNRRIEAGLDWLERWWSGPTYKLDTDIGIYATTNSRSNVDYFNPKKDLAIEAQMINEWMLWRNYRQNLQHRLIFGVGHYWQERFASGMITRVRYEQEWNFDPLRSLSYGAVYERHPYDGSMNESTSVFLNLNWHF